MHYSKYSAVVIGSGISGLYSALKLAQNSEEKILLITKSKLNESNSYYAQGGMVAVLKDNQADSVEMHISDTLKAGAGLSNLNTTKYISENSDSVVHDLLKFGVTFDTDETDKFKLTKEAAHSVRRILHAGGDATGRLMEKSLCNAVLKTNNIVIKENSLAVELLINSLNECAGFIMYDCKTGNYEAVYTNALILATGGIGQLYKYTTNPIGATADGIALAYNAGAELQDMEFVQFHPTALAYDDSINHNRFLISEAVRGEGAKLYNKAGIRFMEKYDDRLELAPRDIVARSIYNEMGNSECVYLDATSINSVQNRFPTIYEKCKSYGIQIEKDYIPVAPAAHYFMGGVKTSVDGITTIKNLYAIGETSSTGLHGANRLASNSLLECVVCAYATAQKIKNNQICEINEDAAIKNTVEKYETPSVSKNIDVENIKQQLKETMWHNVGIYRNETSLKTALQKIDELESAFQDKNKCNSKEEYELKNMLTCAKIITSSALSRKESRGAHYRTDYPKSNDIAVHSSINNKGELNFVK